MKSTSKLFIIQLCRPTILYGENITNGVSPSISLGHFKKTDIRGYTGHEQMPRHKLINMNARLYDPFTARFLSADTMIPDPNIAHSYNRYIYVYDNPLKYTDPSGHWVMFVIGAIIYTIGATSDDPDIQKAGMLIGAVMMGSSLGDMGFSAAQSGAMVGFFSGTVNSGGDVGEGVKQGVISGASAYAVNEIAHGGVNGGSEFSGLEQAGLQGLVGGLTAELRGGKFKDGFAAAVVAKGIEASEILKDVDPTLQGLGTTLAGGLAAKAGGGSFEDGAMSALFVFLYNQRRSFNLREQYIRIKNNNYFNRTPAQQARERYLVREQENIRFNFFNRFRNDPLSEASRYSHKIFENGPDYRTDIFEYNTPTSIYYSDFNGMCYKL